MSTLSQITEAHREHRILVTLGVLSFILCLAGVFAPVGSIGVALASCTSLASTIKLSIRSTGRRRSSWAAISAGTIGLMVLGVTWAIFMGPDSSHTTSILPWTLGSSCAIGAIVLGMVSLISASVLETVRRILDAVTVSCGVGVVVWSASMTFNRAENMDKWEAHASLGLFDELLSTIAILSLLVVSCAIVAAKNHRKTAALWPAVGWLLCAATLAISIATMSQYFTANIEPLSVFLAAGHFGTIWGALISSKNATKPKSNRFNVHPYLPHAALVVATCIATFQRFIYPGFDSTLAVMLGVVVCLVITRSHLIINDNSQLVRQLNTQEAQLKEHAYQDELTGLDNRRKFSKLLQARLDAEQPEQTVVAFLDLDGFKQVNDSFGHAGGDTVLEAVALRLQALVPGAPSIARFAGDEYAIILPHHKTPQAWAEQIVTAVSGPIGVAGTYVTVTASVGVSTWHPDQPRTTCERLIHQADVALYAVKGAGRDGHQQYHPELSQGATSHYQPNVPRQRPAPALQEHHPFGP